MTVKTIFKILIGIIVIMTLSFVFIEFVNVNLNSCYLKQTMDDSVQYACEYFSQESYKINSATNGNMPDAGSVSGTFYIGGSQEDIYNNLYRSSSEFTTFVNSYKGVWSNLAKYQDTSDAFYTENLLTPANLGVTYLDRATLQRIAAWNMTKLLAFGYPGNIEGTGSMAYVQYKGFRVYTNQLQIKGIRYSVVPISSYKFKEITNMDYQNLGVDATDSERTQICVAEVTYSVPVAYYGITPIKELYSYTMRNRVGGLDGIAPAESTETFDSPVVDFNSDVTDDLAVDSTITFYVIR